MDNFLTSMSSMDTEAIDAALCKLDFIYFCNEFCQINDIVSGEWINFRLWPVQEELSKSVNYAGAGFRLVIPKGRQMGASWECGCALPSWVAIFRPNSEILLYSLREDAAFRLLGNTRLGGMLNKLPKHIIPEDANWETIKTNRKERHFSNGSVIYALNPRQGDGHSSKYTFIDEADLFEDLDHTLSIVEPATEHGKLVMASRANKDNGESRFKQLCRNATYYPDTTKYKCFFIPWYDHPRRDNAWYEREAQSYDIDYMYSNYANNIEEFLAPRQLNKRIPIEQLAKCYRNSPPIKTSFDGLIRDPNLKVYQLPDIRKRYYIGADTAEGLEHGDNSSTMVIDDKGEDVANITGKISPAHQASLIRDLSKIYNNARTLIENNFHGAHTISWMQENGCRHLLLKDRNSRKLGWTTTQQSKASLYINLAELIYNEEAIINDSATFDEIQSISKDTLSAPGGHRDDRAMAYALAQMARTIAEHSSELRIIDLAW